MNKIICDMCGTIYQETLEECPTCGTPRPEDAELAGLLEESASPDFQPTKGGRFSSGNVRKRLQTTKGTKPAPAPAPAPRKSRPQPEQRRAEPRQDSPKGKSNMGLIITAIILAVAIIGMLIYIFLNFFMVPSEPEGTVDSTVQTPGETFPPQEQATTLPEDLSCTDLKLSENFIVLKAVGNGWLLNAIPTPANTEDPIVFTSADESVATVSDQGNVVAVGAGETVITVTCGDITVECKVTCDIAPPEETVPPTSEATQPPAAEFKLNREDITFMNKGETWVLYDGEIALTDIQWSVGNTSVATVVNGKVKAVGPGQTTVRAVYNGQEATCIIRCRFSS